MNRVLVTGGAGFLGSHLCEANIAHLGRNPRFEMLRHDVTVPLHVEVDEIYNPA